MVSRWSFPKAGLLWCFELACGRSGACREGTGRNLLAFPTSVDAIVTNAAGCGSGMHEYRQILKGTSQEEEASAFSSKVCDVSVYLTQLGDLETVPDTGRKLRIAYHDACHLANAQNVRQQPRSLLQAIPGVNLCEIADAHLCVGRQVPTTLINPRSQTPWTRRRKTLSAHKRSGRNRKHRLHDPDQDASCEKPFWDPCATYDAGPAGCLRWESNLKSITYLLSGMTG